MVVPYQKGQQAAAEAAAAAAAAGLSEEARAAGVRRQQFAASVAMLASSEAEREPAGSSDLEPFALPIVLVRASTPLMISLNWT